MKMVLTCMEASLCVSICVVVPTPRLVCILCALIAVSLRLCAAYPVFLDSGLAMVCLLCSPGLHNKQTTARPLSKNTG